MNELLLDQLQQFFLAQPDRAFYVKEIDEALETPDAASFKELVKALVELEDRGCIQLTKAGKYQLYQAKDEVEGIFRSNEKGFGFVTTIESEEDIFIARSKTASAMDGDRVRVKLSKQASEFHDKAAEGSIVQILERNTVRVVGVFTRYSSKRVTETLQYGEVALADRKLSAYRCVIQAKGLYPVDGTVVVVELTDYPMSTSQQAPTLTGVIVKELGYKDAVGMDVLTILHQLNIPTEFPDDVIEEANNVSDTISSEEMQGREDLRSQVTITIDGADAKDLDDAISLTRREDGTFLLGVHIADVSHYVEQDSPMDREAYLRGTSVYVTDRVVPMLPQRLSNGICSLHPHEDRLTLSCIMEIDRSGTVYGYRIVETLIHSHHRLTYDQVNAIYAGDEALQSEYAEIVDMLFNMKALHEILARRRTARGAIDFETHETKIIVDEKGFPTDITFRERGVSERLIESFMLAANETVARHFCQLNVPFLYRVHEAPHEEKLQRFLEFITTFGILVKGSSDHITPKKLQQALAQVQGETYEAVVSTMMLRAMKQAKYSIEATGHYGLAAQDYTHFTSPIRRYPDLIVHRMIRFYLTQPLPIAHEQVAQLEATLHDIAEQSSKMERRSVQAEREVEALKKAEFMLDKVGQTFDGIISSVTKFGIFVELANTVEGLIHVSQLRSDYYNFIESHLIMIGERTGKTYRIGDQVRVTVVRVDVEARAVDFVLVEDQALTYDMKAIRKQEKAQKQTTRSRSQKATKKRKERNATKKSASKRRRK